MRQKKKKYPIVLEFLPIVLFFILYHYFGTQVATVSLVAFSIINLLVGYWYTKHFHLIAIVTCVLAVVFGGLTILFNNDSFIKIKVTMINLVFATGLCSTFFLKRNMLRAFMGDRFYLTAKGWRILNFIWIIFFLFLALCNELVWRNTSTSVWVDFKAIGIPVLSVLFFLIQLPIIRKYKKYKK